jgi:eukaryotic-like serine/threonine-protein kinase
VPSTLRGHLEIAMAAVAMGLVDQTRAVDAVMALQRGDTVPGVTSYWVGESLLTTDELRIVCRHVDRRGAPRSSRSLSRMAAPRSSDRYEVTHTIATGGMGQVDDCYDVELNRRVAVKRLAGPARSHEKREVFEAMLDREARLTASLEHPSIIPIYDASSDHSGRYYVMRLVTQQTLAERLDAIREGEEDTGLWRLLRDFVQVCRAVAYAHSRGVTHCDLKPANILLGPFGEVLIVDWGMACSVDDDFVPRGGTLTYMAPEQLDTTRSSYDASTDVFALGGILYELLCLWPPFMDSDDDEAAMAERIRHREGEHVVKRPRERNRHREIPAELEDVAMRAIALEPEDRWGSASEIAQAVEDYLEGKKELERRQKEADELAQHGDELAPRYHELVDSRPQQLAELAGLRREVRPWDPATKKAPLWATQDRVAVTDALRVRTLHAAANLYEQALELVPDHAVARRRLAELYASELHEAQARRDDLAALHFEELARQHDDDAQTTAGDEGLLTLCGDVPKAVLSLTQLMSRDRRLVPATAPRRVSCPAEMTPARGSYILAVELTDGHSVRVPVAIVPGQTTRVDLSQAWWEGLRDDELLILGGDALLGGDSDHAAWSQGQIRHVDTFAIQRWPLTFEAYLAFVREVARDDPRQARELIPRDFKGHKLWRHDSDEGGWQPMPSLGGDAQGISAELPLFGIDLACAEAYAAWLSARRGTVYRLPWDHEWEKAARGVDGRNFPWGDHFDATFCKMRDSRSVPPRPEPAGVFDLDESPYGVRAMAGTIAEWVKDATLDGGSFTRGGAWSDSELDCRLSTRRYSAPTARSTRVGMRLVREVALRRPATEDQGR